MKLIHSSLLFWREEWISKQQTVPEDPNCSSNGRTAELTPTSNGPGNRVGLAAAEQSQLSGTDSNCQPSPVPLPSPGSLQAPRQDHSVLSHIISVKTVTPFFFSPSPNNDCSSVKTKCNIWEIKTHML